MAYFVYRSLQIDVSEQTGQGTSGEVVLRVDGPIFYGNANVVADQVRQTVADRDATRAVVLCMPAQNGLDITTAEMLHDLRNELGAKGIALKYADIPQELRDRIHKLFSPDTDLESVRKLANER